MPTYNDRVTADYSPLLVHFTRQHKMMMKVKSDHPLAPYEAASAKDKLLNILRTRTIHASPMPHLNNGPEAVCFTECVWGGLAELADEAYSPYGVVFQKKLIHDKGGGPALYVRADHLKAVLASVPAQTEAMIAPFDPEAILTKNIPLDWLHEREWRLPGSLQFELGDLSYVIVNTVEDAMTISDLVRLPLRLFIAMEVYRAIKAAWPGGSY